MASFFGAQYQQTQSKTLLGTKTAQTDADRIFTFDNELVNGEPAINQASGIFTINATGNFYISWNVSLKTGLGATGPNVSLEVTSNATGTNPVVKLYPSSNPLKTSELTGSAIIQVEANTVTRIALYNTGTEEITLSSITTIKANITIVPYVTNTSSSTYGLVGAVLTLDAAVDTLAFEAPVAFNRTSTLTESAFSYVASSGVLTLVKAGHYLFDWCINLDGSTDASYIKFALVPDNTTATPFATYESTLLMQQSYNGFAYMTTQSPDTKVRLVNLSPKPNATTGAALMYSATEIKAMMRVVSHT